jgi:hypothetical protein
MGDISARGSEPPKGATFESVWALLQENARQQAEQQKEFERWRKKNEEEFKQWREENARRKREIDQVVKETNLRLGRLGLSMGEISEHLMSPNLHQKFNALGFCFDRGSRNHELRDRGGQRLTEIDVLLENGEYVMAVEVKTRLTANDVKDHVKRMEILRRVADEHGDKRKYLGAVAGIAVTREVRNYAIKNGFYVIIPSGETVEIAIPGGFSPRIW